jgi:hypothetical protein
MDGAIGANGPNTWFTSLGTDMREDDWVPANTAEEQLWAKDDLEDPGKELHWNPVFYLKVNSHVQTAGRLFDVVAFALDNGRNLALTPSSCPTGQPPRTDC